MLSEAKHPGVSMIKKIRDSSSPPAPQNDIFEMCHIIQIRNTRNLPTVNSNRELTVDPFKNLPREPQPQSQKKTLAAS